MKSIPLSVCLEILKYSTDFYSIFSNRQRNTRRKFICGVNTWLLANFDFTYKAHIIYKGKSKFKML